jgi:hypothetical protein
MSGRGLLDGRHPQAGPGSRDAEADDPRPVPFSDSVLRGRKAGRIRPSPLRDRMRDLGEGWPIAPRTRDLAADPVAASAGAETAGVLMPQLNLLDGT